MTLYLISTFGCGDFYIIAKTATEAESLLKTKLNLADHGITRDRPITNIKIISCEVINNFTRSNLPYFSDTNRLLIDTE